MIASSDAGKMEYFSAVFEKTSAGAALAGGIFYREEVKEYMLEKGIET